MANKNMSVVLLLKSKNQNDFYEQLLREHGYEPVFVPVLSFVFTNKHELTQRLKNPDKHCGLVFTSQRAVDALYHCITDNELEEKWTTSLREKWLRLPVFVTGKATAKQVREKLQLSDIYGEDSGSAESLSSTIFGKIPPSSFKALLFPCANIKKETLPRKMEQEGYCLHCVTAYCTKADPNIFETLQEKFTKGSFGQPHCIVFFSPSGVTFAHEALEQIFPSFRQIRLIAIGQSTSQGLKDHGLLVSGIAEKPDPTSLLETIDSSLKDKIEK